MSDLQEPWVYATVKAVKYIRNCQGSYYKKFVEAFPDYTDAVDADYLAWVWDWLVMNTPYEEDEDPGSDALIWGEGDETDFLETEEKFTHRGRNDWI